MRCVLKDGFWKSNAGKIIDFIVRTRTAPKILVSTGCALLISSIASLPTLIATATIGDTKIGVSLRENNILEYVVAATGFVILLPGIFLLISDHRSHARAMSRKRRLVVELRGLDVTLDRSIEEQLQTTPGPPLIARFLDLRKETPQHAVGEISRIPSSIAQDASGKNSNDIELFAGGLAPVPYMFLFGAMLTSQSSCTVVDWNRDSSKWSELDATDDGDRLPLIKEEYLENLPTEVLLTLSTSYTVNSDAIDKTFDTMRRINWELDERHVNSHWSADKQRALSAQFRDFLIRLDEKGVRIIHLVLASQASIALNFGRQLHRRNMPEIRIYQYEVKESPPYPWCIKIPSDEAKAPTVLATKA